VLVRDLELRAFFLDLAEQACVLDRDHRLVGEGLQQPHLLIGEGLQLLAAEKDDADAAALQIIGAMATA